MDYQRTTTTISAPVGAPVDLNAGKPTFGELAPLFGLTLVAIVPVGLGGLLVRWAWPSTYEPIGSGGVLLIMLGGLLMLAGGSWFWTLRGTVLHGMRRYYARLDDWHFAYLTKYEESNGQITATQVDERYLSVMRPPDMLLLLFYVWYTGKVPTVRGLTEGPLLMTAGHRSFVIGRMQQTDAENACSLLARSGIIVDRKERHAGRLAVTDPKQAMRNVLVELSKDPRVLAGMRDEED